MADHALHPCLHAAAEPAGWKLDKLSKNLRWYIGGGCIGTHEPGGCMQAAGGGGACFAVVLRRKRGACTHAGCVARADAVILDGLQDLPRVMAAFGLR